MNMQQKNIIFLILFLFFSLNLTGCMDLASTQRTIDKNSSIKGQVYTMRGLGGIFSTGMNRLEDKFANDYKIRTASTIWYKANALSTFIIAHHQDKEWQGPIILIGHSLGANEQITVAKNLDRAHIPVALLITIDAVAPAKIPPNVQEVFNIYKPSIFPLFSGRALHAVDPQKTHIVNFNVTKNTRVYVNHFTIDKKAEIQKIMLNKVISVINKANKKPIYPLY